nr:TasA family protein [Fredinandcohnia onubensis]
MGIKKKMGLGIAAGALGLSLIGGGTWAAFNDVEFTTNTFAAGTLDLVIENGSFEVTNLKPGDTITRTVTVKNNGSLDFKNLKMSVEGHSFDNKDILDLNGKFGAGSGDNNMADFLSQFAVTSLKVNGTPLTVPADATLNYLLGITDLSTPDGWAPVLTSGGVVTVEYTIEFVEDGETFANSRVHKQNKFQGESATLDFTFEATQMDGEER